MKKQLNKTIVIVLLIFSTVMSTYSQEFSRDSFNIKKTEINIAVADIFARSSTADYYFADSSYINIPYRINSYEYVPEVNFQLGAKFHTLKGAVRISCGFNYSNYSSVDKTNNSVEISYTGSNVRVATGYEWHYAIARVNIYYGADLSWALSNYNHKIIDGPNEIINKSNISYLGINPLLGVVYFITQNLSVGTEVRFTTEIYTGNEKIDSPLNNSTHNYDINGLRTYLGPLGFVSVNIHF